MPGREACCCSAVPKAMMTGATMTGPGDDAGAPASAFFFKEVLLNGIPARPAKAVYP